MNDEMKFDPLTGQPLNNNAQAPSSEVKIESNEEKTNVPEPQQNKVQSVATVEQSDDNFLNNAQSDSTAKNEKINEKSSYIFIFVIFAIILLAIIFLFPLLNKYF